MRAFRLIAALRAKGQTYQRNGHSIRVGHYVIESIDAEGNMVAGCHRFTWAEMKALADREGVAV